MKKIVIGILAHVDSGKTTLSEAMLYNSGEIKKLGRVDHKNSFLDTDSIEKERGITIFSKQAVLSYNDIKITLLDTPGHIDFSSETESTLDVLDYAILVISATDKVQSHTKTLWKMLNHYNIPTFIFINKLDISYSDKLEILKNIKDELDEKCIDFTTKNDSFYETIATYDEEIFEKYINSEKIDNSYIANAIQNRKIYPCFFGSALKNTGISDFLDELCIFTKENNYKDEFGAKIFKISEDEKGQRLVHMKITGGSLRVKTQLEINENLNKINEIRIYSGVKYTSVQEVFPGEICAVTGLNDVSYKDGLGFEKKSSPLLSVPVFSYSVKICDDTNATLVLSAFKKLEQEGNNLKVLWNEYTQKISVQLMGKIQQEILKNILQRRFNISIEFEHGDIIYKETIKNSVEGVGHYEPLRHYAEVHLLLEPGKQGSGLVFKTKCSEDILNKNWQRLILTHLAEKTHIGVLCGFPITDMVITLINGKAHQKHTEGGDFRQATYRAVRQGLCQAESILLEPYFDFLITLPSNNVGKAMTDLHNLNAQIEPIKTCDDVCIIKGNAPVRTIRDYQEDLTLYTHGNGQISFSYKGYFPCENQDEIINNSDYNFESDIENPSDSVFCAHGSGFNVKWDKVFDYMHIEKMKTNDDLIPISQPNKSVRQKIYDDESLLKIFEMTYGKIQRKSEGIVRTQNEPVKYTKKLPPILDEFLLIDGYNIIYAWDELKEIAKESLNDARLLLISKISNYQAMKKNNVILVFDAYKVQGNQGSIEDVNGIKVVYTKEAQTADSYIEKTSQELIKNYRVRVATSDNLVQMIIFGNGAIRVSANEFYKEVLNTEEELREFIRKNNKN